MCHTLIAMPIFKKKTIGIRYSISFLSRYMKILMLSLKVFKGHEV